MTRILIIALLTLSLFRPTEILACSVLYYVDKATGKIYVANNEDYWYDVNPYIQIMPKSKDQLARLWYGWNNFAQGGINEAGLFFDAAVTPEQKMPVGYEKPKGNLGDEILANCQTVDQALKFLETKKVALKNAHLMFGDSSGNAVVVEWVNGERKIISITDNKLIMTNFLLSDPSKGNYPCYRYKSIEESLKQLQNKNESPDLRQVGNTLGKAVQLPQANEDKRVGGTLYSSFINISDMEFVLVYKLDNTKVTKFDLKKEFDNQKKRKLELK